MTKYISSLTLLVIISLFIVGPTAAQVAFNKELAVDIEVSGQENLLRWATLSEKGIQFFIVQRSSNGDEFEPLGVIQSAGTKETGKDYSFIDLNVQNKDWFYRLVYVNKYGEGQYSDSVYRPYDRNGLSSIFSDSEQDITWSAQALTIE